MTSSLLRKILSLSTVAMIASTLALPAFATGTMSNPCAAKPASHRAHSVKHTMKKRAMKKHVAAKHKLAGKKKAMAANPCAAKH